MIQAVKPKKSVKLSPKEWAWVNNEFHSYPSQVEASIGMKIGRETLVRIVRIGSCTEQTYNKLFPLNSDNAN